MIRKAAFAFLISAVLASAGSIVLPSSAEACGGGAMCGSGEVCCQYSSADQQCVGPIAEETGSALCVGGGGHPVTDSQGDHQAAPAGCTEGQVSGSQVCSQGKWTSVPASSQGSSQSSPSTQTQSSSGGLQNPLKAGSITELLNIVLKAVVEIGSILLVLALVWVGFLFVAAQGAEEKIRDARTALMWTVIGGLILLGAEAISQVITATVQAL